MNQPKEIHFIVNSVQDAAGGGFKSSVASNRYRVALPAQGLSTLGYQVGIIDSNSWRAEMSRTAAAVVVGKLVPKPGGQGFSERAEKLLFQVERCRQAGVPVVGDFNDVHFDSPILGPYWRKLATSVDACVAGSDQMAKLLKQYSDAQIFVVDDPIASPCCESKTVYQPPTILRSLLGRQFALLAPPKLQLAWFGHPVNWGPMAEWAEKLIPLSRKVPFVLWMVTTPEQAILADVDRLSSVYGSNAKIHLVPWSLESQWEVVKDCDIVLIPSRPDSIEKSVKTSNRLTDALNMGRYVVASPISSYLRFRDQVQLTDDPVQGINNILNDPVDARKRLIQGQAFAQQAFSVQAIGRQWLEVLVGLPKGAGMKRGVELNSLPVRLNLGCGDKILPNFVNVDVVPSRMGKAPDVLCDLHDLSVFPDNHADEVIAIHVVEHFWRWEVEDVLREWVRVLKPGGLMVLECPNLVSACEEFLRDPDLHSYDDKRGQKTMWVFYGDPAWKDPYMIHRWGYTPKSLMRLMSSVGLINVRQEPAQYKLREPRDMRVVGIKASG